MGFMGVVRRVSGVLALVGLVVAGQAQGQAWEKLIAPGLTYRMEIDLGLPRVIHALRYTPGGEVVSARPELAKNVIMIPEEAGRGRDTLGNTVRNKGAIAGVNGDFFPWTGDPLGLMVRDGELKSTPMAGRSAFVWGPGYSYAGVVDMQVTIRQGDVELVLNGVNQEIDNNQAVLSTSFQGTATAKTTAVHAILEPKGVLAPGKTVAATIKIFSPDNTNQKIGENEFVISATGNKIPWLTKFKRGEDVMITVDSKAVDWDKGTQAIGGGPLLVKDGKVVDQAVAERFERSFSTTRHPRTAVGVTANGDIWMVVIDGRQPAISRGATLQETAQLMLRLGCVQAINLDGGGSSTMNVGGVTVNRPSEGTQRAISNSLLVFGTLHEPVEGAQYVIRGRPRIAEGESETYSVVSATGEEVPAREVLWAAQGAGWVDQAGVLRAHGNGRARLTARVGGTVVTVDVTIDPKAPARAGN